MIDRPWLARVIYVPRISNLGKELRHLVGVLLIYNKGWRRRKTEAGILGTQEGKPIPNTKAIWKPDSNEARKEHDGDHPPKFLPVTAAGAVREYARLFLVGR
jgi:hypothetical protein